MANTYTLIQAQTLASTSSSVTFTSIPQTYTDLVLRISARESNTSVLIGSIGVTFDSSTFSTAALFCAGATVTTNRRTNSTNFYVNYPGANAGISANTFGSSEIYIPNYTLAQTKPISSFTVTENNSATVNEIYVGAHLYRTEGAVTSITLTPSATFAIGSSFYLYGIKNS